MNPYLLYLYLGPLLLRNLVIEMSYQTEVFLQMHWMKRKGSCVKKAFCYLSVWPKVTRSSHFNQNKITFLAFYQNPSGYFKPKLLVTLHQIDANLRFTLTVLLLVPHQELWNMSPLIGEVLPDHPVDWEPLINL